jgi:hypothetical protein
VKQEVVTKTGAAITDRYIYPDRALQAKAKIDAALAAGDYDAITEPVAFAQRLTDDLQSITHDKHMRVSFQGGPPPAAPQTPPSAPAPTSGGFARVDRLKGNVGYIKLNNFPPPPIFNPAADDALLQLAGTDALIIDMRDNGGGSAEADSYFGSFFFDPRKPVQLNSIVNRKQGTQEFSTTEFWTKPVASPYLNKPVYILTSKRTFSGGEAFVYDMQVLKRATIYGETTGGGANPGGTVNVGQRFSIFIPGGRAENPITKTNWEGTGVVPEHAMDAQLAFQAAMSDAVTKLLATTRNDAALTAVKADLAKQSEPSAFVEASLLKFRTTASPGTEAALRNFIEGLIKGEPPYAMMTPGMADVVRTQPTPIKDWGALKTITFKSVGPLGGDLYEVVFANAKTEWQIAPLMDGKIGNLGFRPLP